MQAVAGWIGVLLAMTLLWGPAAADDELLDPSYRWLWTLPAVKVDADASYVTSWREVLDIRRTSDGGYLVLGRQVGYRLFNIKLDRDGRVEHWTQHEWCLPAVCEVEGHSGLPAWRSSDESFWLQYDYIHELIRFAPDGSVTMRIALPDEFNMYGLATLLVPDGSMYIAGEKRRRWTGPALLVRLRPDGSDEWRLELPLPFGKQHMIPGEAELDLLANGDLLWWIDGHPPMTTGRSRDYLLRITPSGSIRPPGPLEGSVPSDRGAWRVIGHHLLPDGRLLRYGEWLEDPAKGFLRLEFWDGTGERLLTSSLLDLSDPARPLKRLDDGRVLDANGNHAFYMGGFRFEGGELIVGFDHDGTAAWRKLVPGKVVSGDGSSTIYFSTCSQPNPVLYNCGRAIYSMRVE